MQAKLGIVKLPFFVNFMGRLNEEFNYINVCPTIGEFSLFN